LGIFFRFAHLDRKVYWHDEVYTSLRINGYNGKQVFLGTFVGKPIAVEDLLAFQRPSPQKDLRDTLAMLIEHPEHPPLYFLMAHFWVRWWGSSVAAIRSLSAILSLLVFPALYWLCWELFRNQAVGWCAIALVAVSPFHVLYAQEARQYSLWTIAILLAGAAFLRGIRLTQQHVSTRSLLVAWGIYTVTLALSFYTFLFSGLVAIAHALYLLIIERFRPTKTLLFFALSSSLALLLFSPWLWVIATNYSQVADKTSWTTRAESFAFLAKLWGLNLSSIFADYGLELESSFTYLVPPLVFIFLVVLFYLFCRQTPKQVWLFPILSIAVNALALIVPDLIFGGVRSSVGRYFLPCYIGFQLAVAYVLTLQLSSSRAIQRRIGKIAIALIVTAGVVSCAVSFQAQTWWNKSSSYSNPEIAALINRVPEPLVVSDNNEINVGNLVSLSYLLKPETTLLLTPQPITIEIPEKYEKIFLYNPSSKLLAIVEEKYKRQAKLVYPGYLMLWEF